MNQDVPSRAYALIGENEYNKILQSSEKVENTTEEKQTRWFGGSEKRDYWILWVDSGREGIYD